MLHTRDRKGMYLWIFLRKLSALFSWHLKKLDVNDFINAEWNHVNHESRTTRPPFTTSVKLMLVVMNKNLRQVVISS